MVFGLLVMLTALAISAVAIYYSVAGLAAIFAAAALPIIIMGGILEVSKLVTAVWLHRYWDSAKWWLKYYLTTAVVVLMLITSMGIFGFLSKAHIEQTSAGEESQAQIVRIESELGRQENIIDKAENKIKELETTGTGGQANIQAQIDKEQERIDTAYERIQPAIDEQNKIISNVSELYQKELDKIDLELKTLQGYIDNNEVKKAQQMVGARADGAFGSRTAKAFQEFQEKKKEERKEWLQKIQDAAQSPTVIQAREEIKRLRANADKQIAESNKLINKYRDKLSADSKVDITSMIEEQYLKIKKANSQIDTLTEEKYTLQGEYRKLEAEVGPIKYIAEFIYGDNADRDMLEEAVRWVIITIIFVFDPLAVLLLIASQYTFQYARRKKNENKEWKDYEKARAQKIVDNQKYEDVSDEELEQELEEEVKFEDVDQETLDKEAELDKTFENEVEKNLQPTFDLDPSIDEKIEKEIKKYDEEIKEEADTIAQAYKEDKPKIERLTEAQIDELDQHPQWTEAKRKWKDENPNRTIKSYKERYLLGEIDEFPWESYLEDDDAEAEQAKEGLKESATVEEALRLPETESVQTPINESLSSDSDETTVDTGYIQNEEQNEDTNWRKLRDKDE
tara:strand:+ start:390 stop:2264 length:1875 start_codon:yes stop_codon:yes gene_type:complete